MKAANNGSAEFGEVAKNLDDKESAGGAGGGRGREKSGDDDEGNVSDRGDDEEEEEEEAARKNRLGPNKRGGDDDEEGTRGVDLDLDDDDVEKGDDGEHEEIFSDDDEAVGNDPEEREDLAAEIPAPPEIKQELSRDEEDVEEDVEEAAGMNESDAEETMTMTTMWMMTLAFLLYWLQSKRILLRRNLTHNSPSKPAPSGPARGTPSASKSARGKRKSNGDDTKASNDAPLKKESKSIVEDGNVSTSKSGVPPKGVQSSSTTGSTSSGPVTEEEVRACLLQKAPIATKDLVANFKARVKSSERKKAFADILRRISRIRKTNGPNNFVELRDK